MNDAQAPTLRQRLQDDLKTAMRGGDQTGRDVIRYVLAAIKNAEIDKGGALAPADELAVLQRQAKQRHEAIEQFRSGGRVDLADRESAQLEILNRYLPAAMSDDELAALAAAVSAEVGATGPKDMARVMPALIARVDGRADGRRVSAAAKQALAARA